ncbi:hypothetical protein EYF80_067451 [Liparis tanakae]|uniref:Uncharacterized protein n=1 Tax=Liparis tanakae TaxID=230148 RepID=A0A4Z2E0Y5_9TELE|nr:hypothetical protein EYF80_067451 [Liparis tanakae]
MFQIRTAGWESSPEGWSTRCCGRKEKSSSFRSPRKTSASTKHPVSPGGK